MSLVPDFEFDSSRINPLLRAALLPRDGVFDLVTVSRAWLDGVLLAAECALRTVYATGGRTFHCMRWSMDKMAYVDMGTTTDKSSAEAWLRGEEVGLHT